jgi:hypothetical protein
MEGNQEIDSWVIMPSFLESPYPGQVSNRMMVSHVRRKVRERPIHFCGAALVGLLDSQSPEPLPSGLPTLATLHPFTGWFSIGGSGQEP